MDTGAGNPDEDEKGARDYIERRRIRQRRRGDEVRYKAKLRRWWRMVTPNWTHKDGYPRRLPDPRNCSCYLCRSADIEHARYVERKGPRVDDWEA